MFFKLFAIFFILLVHGQQSTQEKKEFVCIMDTTEFKFDKCEPYDSKLPVETQQSGKTIPPKQQQQQQLLQKVPDLDVLVAMKAGGSDGCASLHLSSLTLLAIGALASFVLLILIGVAICFGCKMLHK
uniref:Uncharacterized protein n=1 Tax=Globodera pallida TaxID=36090 RepID=A0A183BS98_GLOPA